MYLDSAYIVKYYVNEPDADAARRVIREASHICSSALARIEVTCVFHRHVREGSLTPAQGYELIDLFHAHADAGLWSLIPVSDGVLSATSTLIRGLPRSVPMRAGDAIHLASALEARETEIWTTDRHLLAATAYVGLSGCRM